MQYDTIALLAAVPSLRRKYFSPVVLPPLSGQGASPAGVRSVIGLSDTSSQVRDPPALIKMLRDGFTAGLRLNHQARALLIFCMQLGTHTLADALLACLFLRSLWDLGLCSCIAILLSFDPVEVNAIADSPRGNERHAENGEPMGLGSSPEA
eukprot:7236842-Prymnesium_polylepis.1